MANTFTLPYTIGRNQAKTVPFLERTPVLEARSRFRRQQIPEIDLAPSLMVPSGRKSASGWILVRRSDLAAIQALNTTALYATNFQIQFDECVSGRTPITFKNLSIVQSRCVTTGSPAGPDAVYLVELTDARGLLSNTWYQFPLIAYYNVRSPAYPQQYYTASLNGGFPWTWNGMVRDLWERMTVLGTYPGLPIAPTGTPENWSFPGVPCWDALCNVLDLIGCAVTCDLTSDTHYGIAYLGNADAAFTLLQTQNRIRLADDQAWIDVGAGRVPGTVTVCFHRRNQYYGTEETVRRDSLQWQTNSIYTVSVSAPATFSGATGTHLLWDDFQVQFDVDGSPLAADVATAAAIAADRATQYFATVYAGTVGFLSQQYEGLIGFLTGSLVDQVRWFQWPDKRLAWRTEIKRGVP